MTIGPIIIPGDKFGRLTIVERGPVYPNSKSRAARWVCECECGTKKVVVATYLRTGQTRSCGCLQREVARGELVSNMERTIKQKAPDVPQGCTPIDFEGEVHSIAEWARIVGCKPATLAYRLRKGWPVGKALGRKS